MSKSSYLSCVTNELYATFGISSDEEVAIWKHSLSKERRETSTNWKVPKPLDTLGKGENRYRREDRRNSWFGNLWRRIFKRRTMHYHLSRMEDGLMTGKIYLIIKNKFFDWFIYMLESLLICIIWFIKYLSFDSSCLIWNHLLNDVIKTQWIIYIERTLGYHMCTYDNQKRIFCIPF